MAERAEIFEVGPRDGLQNEARQIETRDKIALVDLLSRVGFSRIEVASFVSPKWVPQMADGADVLAGINRAPDVSYAALAPNMRGFDRAISARASEVAIFGSASQGFSCANINCSISESFDRFRPIIDAARVAKVPVRGYVSCTVECPYDGLTSPEMVAQVAGTLLEMGCYEISLGDTLGRSTAAQTDKMLGEVLTRVPAQKLAGHFHDTSGGALENIDVALDRGLRVFDAAVGGLGGCPFAPGAAGNVASETVHDHLTGRGFETGLDARALRRAATFARSLREPI